jgi:hypothetical protein
VNSIDLRVKVFDADDKPLRDSDVIREARSLEIVDKKVGQDVLLAETVFDEQG